MRLALYIFASILVISLGAYLFFRQRDNSPSRSVTRKPDTIRRDFRKEAVIESQEEQTTEEVKSEPQEEQPTEEEVKSEPQEEQPTEEEVKSEPQEQPPEDEKK